MATPDELDHLERDLRALLPVAISLGYQENTSSRELSDRVIRLVMKCARLSFSGTTDRLGSPADE